MNKVALWSSMVMCAALALPAASLAADMSDSNPPPKAGSQSPSNTGHSHAVTGTDLTFLNEAAPGGMAEVELGSLALNPDYSRTLQFATGAEWRGCRASASAGREALKLWFEASR